MSRDCYFCRKTLEVHQRDTVFCSQRCQSLYNDLQRRQGQTRPAGQTVDQPADPAKQAPPRP